MAQLCSSTIIKYEKYVIFMFQFWYGYVNLTSKERARAHEKLCVQSNGNVIIYFNETIIKVTMELYRQANVFRVWDSLLVNLKFIIQHLTLYRQINGWWWLRHCTYIYAYPYLLIIINTGIQYVTEIVFMLCQRWKYSSIISQFYIQYSQFHLCIIY